MQWSYYNTKISGCIKNPPSTHTHSHDSVAIEAVKTIGDIKLRSTLTEEPTSSVIQNSTKFISIPAGVKLPSKNSLSKIMRRKRRAPDDDFSESVHTTRGEKIKISNNPELDLIVLGNQENIQMLTRYPNWFCDGTFDSAPVGYQLYTIRALLN